MTRTKSAVALLLMASTAVGCAAPSGLSDWGDSLTFWKHAGDGDRQPSESFLKAKRELHHPEQTMLAYGRYLEDNEQYAQARETYRDLVSEYPDCIDACLGLARIEAATGRNVQAEEILTDLASAHPQETSVWLELGRLHSLEADWQQAITAFSRAVELDDRSEVSRYELGVALIHAGQFNEGQRHLEFAVGRSASLYNIGYVLHEAGRDQEAYRWFDEALRSHPDARTESMAKKMLVQLEHDGFRSEPLIPSGTGTTSGIAQSVQRNPEIISASHTTYIEPATEILNAPGTPRIAASTAEQASYQSHPTGPVYSSAQQDSYPGAAAATYQTTAPGYPEGSVRASMPIAPAVSSQGLPPGHTSFSTEVPDWHRSDSNLQPVSEFELSPVNPSGKAGASHNRAESIQNPPDWPSAIGR
ncbi:MAG: tetratricopeptide repeat protein [Planctomycetaceae bacterium]|nr:tetratricopeptide repeat protein [Planctomycetaceae bacterium]